MSQATQLTLIFNLSRTLLLLLFIRFNLTLFNNLFIFLFTPRNILESVETYFNTSYGQAKILEIILIDHFNLKFNP